MEVTFPIVSCNFTTAVTIVSWKLPVGVHSLLIVIARDGPMDTTLIFNSDDYVMRACIAAFLTSFVSSVSYIVFIADTVHFMNIGMK